MIDYQDTITLNERKRVRFVILLSLNIIECLIVLRCSIFSNRILKREINRKCKVKISLLIMSSHEKRALLNCEILSVRNTRIVFFDKIAHLRCKSIFEISCFDDERMIENVEKIACKNELDFLKRMLITTFRDELRDNYVHESFFYFFVLITEFIRH